MYENLLASIALRMDTTKLVILPSSVHEVIVLKYSGVYSVEVFKDMVASINAEEVPREEVLSDVPFIYDITTDSITLME